MSHTLGVTAPRGHRAGAAPSTTGGTCPACSLGLAGPSWRSSERALKPQALLLGAWAGVDQVAPHVLPIPKGTGRGH